MASATPPSGPSRPVYFQAGVQPGHNVQAGQTVQPPARHNVQPQERKGPDPADSKRDTPSSNSAYSQAWSMSRGGPSYSAQAYRAINQGPITRDPGSGSTTVTTTTVVQHTGGQNHTSSSTGTAPAPRPASGFPGRSSGSTAAASAPRPTSGTHAPVGHSHR